MTEWEELDVRSKLGMLLTADMSNTLQVRALAIMLMQGEGYEPKAIEEYGVFLQGIPDYDYRVSLGLLRAKYLPKDMPCSSICDLDVLEGIATLSREQQISCAENLIDRLTWAKSVSDSMYAGKEIPQDVQEIIAKGEEMVYACRSLLKDLGEV